MKVLIDARIAPSTVGGVEQVVVGFAQGLAELEQPDEVTFLTTEDDTWLRPSLGRNRIVHPRRAARSMLVAADALRRRSLDRVPALRRLPVFGSPLPSGSLVPVNWPEVVHFITQQGFSIRAPSLYSPYDLLHLHHPEYFAAAEVARRERVYRTMCRQADLVMAMTSWTRDDLIESYGLDPERVRIIPGAVSAGPRAVDVGNRYRLPARFALFPAHTWPHKNHVRLLEALAVLRDRDGLIVPLVCTGYEDSHAPSIHEAKDRLGLGDQVSFLGRIPARDLGGLYHLACCLVFPSIFEGWGMPVFEAFSNGVPVVCSTATSLPEQTRGAAVLFDPLDVDAMAIAIARVWEDERLRERLVVAGYDRIRTLAWRRTAMAHCALYREVAEKPLDELDRALISASRDGSVERVELPPSVSANPKRS